jgi:DNA-directed RNA polymerase subunit RPC12/RpoP
MKRSVQSYLKEWRRALMIEVNHLKEHGGERHTLRKGSLLTRGQNEAVYLFHLSADLFLPDGAPVRFVFQGEEDRGEIITADNQELILRLPYLGRDVEQLDIYSEPWELLESLNARLDEIAEVKSKRVRIKRLMTGEAPVKHTEKKPENALHEVILRSHYNAVTYIWGPPGTGKTYTLSRIAASHYRRGKKILILSHSNAAVDVLMLALTSYVEEKKLFKRGAVIRYGTSRNEQIKNHAALLSSKLVEDEHPHLSKKRALLEEERRRLGYGSAQQLARVDEQLQYVRSTIAELEKELIEHAKVIGVTLSKAAADRVIYEQEYDLVIIDEISMAYVPQVAFAAALGKKTVVCGDFKQLPPIAMSEHAYVNEWLKEDLFHQAGVAQKAEQGQEHPHLFMLTRQRRMHEQIAAFTNKYIYGNKVSNHPSVRLKAELAGHLPFSKEAAVFLNIKDVGAFALKDAVSDSRFNLLSALLAVSYMIRASKSGIRSIGYVTPYKTQARLMNSLIQEILPGKEIFAATVHKFQGSERDMIIFDLVDSFPQSRPGILLTEKKGDRLVNVAMTRARGKLLVMGNAGYMKGRVPKERAIAKLIQHFNENGHFYEKSEYLRELIQHKQLTWYKASDDQQWKKDVINARHSIVLCIPHASKVPPNAWAVLKEAKATLTILTKEPSFVPIQEAKVIVSPNPLAFSIFDEKIGWVNQPYVHPAFPSGRLYAPDSIDLLMEYIDWTAAEISEKESDMQIRAGKENYPLSKYLDIWERCPECGSRREGEITAKGKVRLLCHHCGNTGGVTRFILDRYLQYADVRCVPCGQELEALSDGGTVYAACRRCEQTVQPRQLFDE